MNPPLFHSLRRRYNTTKYRRKASPKFEKPMNAQSDRHERRQEKKEKTLMFEPTADISS